MLAFKANTTEQPLSDAWDPFRCRPFAHDPPARARTRNIIPLPVGLWWAFCGVIMGVMAARVSSSGSVRLPDGTFPPSDGSWQNRVIEYDGGLTETVSRAEVRLKRSGLREAWQLRSYQLQKDGRVLPESERMSWEDCQALALLEFPPGCEAYEEQLPGDLSPQDKSFVRLCHSALRGQKMRDRSSIDAEVAWIAANLHMDRPEVHKAPSRAALCQAIDARMNPKVRESFWRIYWTKRMSPGDGGSRAKEKAFREDQATVEQDSADARDESLLNRLWGDSDG